MVDPELKIYIENTSCKGWHASIEAWLLVLFTLAA
jgi:hypothetical protein